MCAKATGAANGVAAWAAAAWEEKAGRQSCEDELEYLCVWESNS